MLRKFFASLFFLLSITTPAKSKNFVEDIETYYSKNNGTVSLIYSFNRCSGVLAYYASMLFKKPDEQNDAITLVQFSSAATEFATELHSKHNNLSISQARITMENRMMELDELYRKDAKENFLKRGRYLSPIILSDINYCVKEISDLLKS